MKELDVGTIEREKSFDEISGERGENKETDRDRTAKSANVSGLIQNLHDQVIGVSRSNDNNGSSRDCIRLISIWYRTLGNIKAGSKISSLVGSATL